MFYITTYAYCCGAAKFVLNPLTSPDKQIKKKYPKTNIFRRRRIPKDFVTDVFNKISSSEHRSTAMAHWVVITTENNKIFEKVLKILSFKVVLLDKYKKGKYIKIWHALPRDCMDIIWNSYDNEEITRKIHRGTFTH